MNIYQNYIIKYIRKECTNNDIIKNINLDLIINENNKENIITFIKRDRSEYKMLILYSIFNSNFQLFSKILNIDWPTNYQIIINKFKEYYDINKQSIHNNTLLVNAILAGNYNFAEELIKNGANLYIENIYGYNALMCVYFNEQIDNHIVKLLIKQHKSINKKNIDGISILALAISRTHIYGIKLLLKNNADINILDSDGNTPLILAVKQNNIDIVNLLLQYKPDINIKNNEEYTALLYALENNNINCIISLLKHNANKEIVYKSGNTALIFSIDNNNIDNVKLLLEYGANINTLNIEGQTPLIYSIFCNNIEIVNILLSYSDININARSNNGNTALMFAIHRKYIDIIKILLENNANINIQNNKGITPLMQAIIYNDVPIILILLKYIKKIKIIFDKDSIDTEQNTGLIFIKEDNKHIMEQIKTNRLFTKYIE